MKDDDPNEDGKPRSSASAVDLTVLVDEPGWRQVADDPEAVVEGAVAATLDAFEPEPVELSVVLADDAAVRALNLAHRGKDAPTNVLSFPPSLPPSVRVVHAGPRPLGDVILALQTVRREAEEQGKTAADHLRHLVVHGVLHLSGYDHQSDTEAEEMEALERRILAAIGVADPYAEAGSAATGGRAA